ncbi:putative Smg1-Like Protein-Like [Manis pentadactyla]|nr:putative Smg1-Like Protein-Like [Manis pentadactyla]
MTIRFILCWNDWVPEYYMCNVQPGLELLLNSAVSGLEEDSKIIQLMVSKKCDKKKSMDGIHLLLKKKRKKERRRIKGCTE